MRRIAALSSALLLALGASAGVAGLGAAGAGRGHHDALASWDRQVGRAALAITKLRGDSSYIELIDRSGRRVASLARHAGWFDEEPAWSPDRTALAFTRSTNRRRSFHLFVVRASGGGLYRLTSGRFDGGPAWSPDGDWIAYQASDGLRLVHPDGSNDHEIAGTNHATYPAWSPDGRRLAFTQGRYVWSALPDGLGRRRIVKGREPDWSPDGKRLAYTLPGGGLASVSPDGSGRRLLGKGMEPDWSPRGTKIALTRWPPSLRFSVWTMTADGSGRRMLVPDARSPDWRP